MVKIKSQSKFLVISKNSVLQLLYRNPIFNDYGSHSNPFNISANSNTNKFVFNFPSRLTKKDLNVKGHSATVSHGTFQQKADIELLSAKSDVFEVIMYFQEGSFANLTENKTLKDVDYGEIINMGSSPQDVADFVNSTNNYSPLTPNFYPKIDFCFPTILAENFYGNSNDQYPEFSGIINKCNATIGFKTNTVGQEESTPMPALFAFYILEKIATTFGYQLKGYDVLNNEKYNQLILIHNQPLDEISGGNYVHAENKANHLFSAANSPALTVLPTEIEDSNDQWNGQAFTITEEGHHEINYELKAFGFDWIDFLNLIEFTIYKDGEVIEKEYHNYWWYTWVNGFNYDGNYDPELNLWVHAKDWNTDWVICNYKKTHYFSASDIGKTFYIKVASLKNSTEPYYAIHHKLADSHFSNQILKITNIESQNVNRFKKNIDLKDHVPPIDISTFLDALQKTTNTILDFDDEHKIVTIKDFKSIWESPKEIDYSDNIIKSSKEVDYNTIHGQVTMAYPSPKNLEDYDRLPDTITEFPDFALENQIIRVTSLNAYFIYLNKDSATPEILEWVFLAPDHHLRTYGEISKNIESIEFPIPPIQMDLYNDYYMPFLDETGISNAYDVDGNSSDGFFAFWKGNSNTNLANDFYCTPNLYNSAKSIDSNYKYSLELDWLYENSFKNYISWLISRKLGVYYKGYLSSTQLKAFHKLDVCQIFGEKFYINQITANIDDKGIEVEFELFLR